MKNTHEIPEPWRSQLRAHFAERAFQQRCALTIAGVIAREAEIPEGWSVSDDGSKITWETKDPPKE